MIKLKLPALMLVTEPSNKLPWIVSEALNGGITVVQYRQKTGAGSGYNRSYAGVTAVVQDAVPLLVNTVWESTVKLRAAHVHLPEKSVSIAAARKEVGPRGIIGKSVHSVASAELAEQEGVDYILAGTIFPSASHPGQGVQGIAFLELVCKAVKVPVLAIGGVTVEDVVACVAVGASGVAVLSPIMLAKDPAEVARQYRKALDDAWIKRNDSYN